MIVHGNQELRTTGERWNAGHKGRESIVQAKEDVLGGTWIVATDKARCFGGGISAVCSSRAQLAV